MLNDTARLQANRERREEIKPGDVVVSYTDGTAYGTVEKVGTKVLVRWGARVPLVDGHRRKTNTYEPFQFRATDKERPRWRLWPYETAAKKLL